MSVPSVHCEAKLHGFRRTADGVVVSFVLHPAEVPQALALDPLGTRYMLALAQIGDDERPVSPAGTSPHDAPASAHPPTPAGEPHAAKERYAAMSLAEQAVVRAGMLPKDERFRAWVAHKLGWHESLIASEQDAVEYIRGTCDGQSRRLIVERPECYDRFIAMETDYLIDIGHLATPR